MKYPLIYAYAQTLGGVLAWYKMQAAEAEKEGRPEDTTVYFIDEKDMKHRPTGKRRWVELSDLKEEFQWRLQNLTKWPRPLYGEDHVPE